MLNLGTIFCLLGCDTSGLNAGESRMAKFVGTANRQFAQVEKSAAGLGKTIAGVIGFETIRRGVMLADSYKGLNARIQQSTKLTKDYLAVQERLEKMSMDIGGGFEGNVSLFQNIARSAPDIGATQKEVLRLVESLNKLSVISGAGPEAMKNAMMQFGQSMAGGIVRAEEFNSIIENTPEIANRIAKGLGMSVGQLRMAVVGGKVLSKDVFASLLKQSAEIDKDFGEMPRRIGQSMESLETGTMKFLGQLDQSFNVTGSIADAIQGIAVYLSGDFSSTINDIQVKFAGVGASIGLWGDIFRDADSAFGGISTKAGGLFETIQTGMGWLVDALIELPINLAVIMDEGKLAFAGMFLTAKMGVDHFGNAFDIVWQLIKAAAATTAAFIAQQFSSVISKILGGISDMAVYAGNLAGEMGFEDTANAIHNITRELDTSEKGVLDFAKTLKKSADDSMLKVEELVEKTKDIDAEWKKGMDTLDAEGDASTARYEAEMKNLDDLRSAKEQQLQYEKDMAAQKKYLAEQAYNSQKPGTPSNPKGTDPLGGGSGAAAKAASEAQQRLDALVKSLQNETEVENAHYAESLAILDQAEANKIASIMPYHELRERLEADHMKKLNEIVRDGEEEMSAIRGLNAFLGVKIQETAGSMEIEAQAKTFKGLIDDAAEHSKAFFEMKKALALATALIDAPKAVLASFAFGSEIGGPVVGAIFGGIAAAAVGVQVASIASAQYTAAKAMGGNVFAGGAYKVNEQGPELLSTGGEDFLMMGSKGGKITPNHMLGGGSGGEAAPVNVIINNFTDAKATVREKDGVDGKTIEIILKHVDSALAGNIIEGKGKIPRAIQQTYRLGRGNRAKAS